MNNGKVKKFVAAVIATLTLSLCSAAQAGVGDDRCGQIMGSGGRCQILGSGGRQEASQIFGSGTATGGGQTAEDGGLIGSGTRNVNGLLIWNWLRSIF